MTDNTALDPSEPPTEPTLQERFRAALPHATRSLPGALPRKPVDELRSLADETAQLEDPDEWDRYGGGGPVGVLETRVAELLGKPAAAMYPSGIMAQQSVLRVWSDRRASTRIAIPELSHLLCYETDGPQQLNGFRYERLTTGPAVATAEHLAAIPGRLVAGPDDVVDEARRWRGRHGGTLFSMLPHALAGLRGLRTQLPRMGEYHERAVELAGAFEDRGFRIHPQPPHTNAFRVFVDQPEGVVNGRVVQRLEDDRVALLPPLHAGDMPGTSWAEFTVGEATMEWGVPEAADAIGSLLG